MTWGREVHVVGAPALAPLEIGPLRMERPMVYFTEERPNRIAELWGGKADGVLGNALFEEHAVLIDSRPGKMRFGVGNTLGPKVRLQPNSPTRNRLRLAN